MPEQGVPGAASIGPASSLAPTPTPKMEQKWDTHRPVDEQNLPALTAC
jgi:hypothetical protein